MTVSLSDLYALIVREFVAAGDTDALELDARGLHWVMDLGSYRQIRAACRAAGVIYPDGDDPDGWVPKPEDRLYGLRVEVRDDGGAPHVERPGWPPLGLDHVPGDRVTQWEVPNGREQECC